LLPESDVQLAPGPWFGEEPRVFRLGFGYLPLERLKEALRALSKAIDAVKG
jgi:DNA-binding transcriptional MocR family regulator